MTKEKILELFKEKARKPLSFKDVSEIFGQNKKSKRQLNNLLDQLIAEGALVKTRNSRYALPEQMNLRLGRIKKNIKGFAFLISENPDQDDLFIPSGALNGALNQDQVLVRVTRPIQDNKRTGMTQRAEGEVVRIIERAKTTYLGTVRLRQQHYAFVEPDDLLFDGDIFISLDNSNEIQEGDKVLVEIMHWPEKKRRAEGKIIEVIGNEEDIGADVLSIVYQHHLRPEFPPQVQDAARQIHKTIDAAVLSRREDLRRIPFVTIDGSDSKDFDDAVYAKKLTNDNYFLAVAIADVGEYVAVGSVLDKEAFKRGTSVYLVDRVLPMLPEELSNDICSLIPGEDRLVIACTMEITPLGQVKDSECFEAVINSHGRLTYDKVNDFLNQSETAPKEYQSFHSLFETLSELQTILHEKRLKRGAIEFDLQESFVRLNDDGSPIDVGWRSRGQSERIIEECMIVANETIAEKYHRLSTPFIYRVHDAPERLKLEEVRDYLQALGYTLRLNDGAVEPHVFQKLLEQVENRGESYSVNMVLLRSMKHAYYSTKVLGHFGLASSYYTHFTSPIRRYSDLAVHRVIKEVIRRKHPLSAKRYTQLMNDMVRYAEQASITERIAEEAERDSQDLKKVEYMSDYVGDIFDALIVGVTAFGFFIQLDNSVEGLVHISHLVDDFYHYLPQTMQLIGEHNKQIYQLGQRVKVRLINADLREVKLDFEIVND